MEALKDECEKQPVLGLARCWEAHVELAYGKLTTPLTPKQFGQLKQLRKYLGIWAVDVVRWAVDNWWRFSQEAKYGAGLACAPDRPHIGFLLAHQHTAVNQMYEIAKHTNPTTPGDEACVQRVLQMWNDLMAKQQQELQEQIQALEAEAPCTWDKPMKTSAESI